MGNGLRLGVRAIATGGFLSLCACGGDGADHVSSIPAAPSPTAPTSPPAIRIFATPTVGDFVSVGASIAGDGGNLTTHVATTDRFGQISTDSSNQVQFRYTAGGTYEVKMPAADWDQLIPYKGLADPDSATNNYFQPASVPVNEGYVVTRNARNLGYLYSELASWGSKAQGRWGYVAFGLPTPVGGVPTSGSATFKGVVSGTTDIMIPDNLYGGYVPLSTDGNVTLDFNFGSGTLAGSLELNLPIGGMNPERLGTYAFRDTVYSAGSTTYSGRFDTGVTGQNFFSGRFTGPTAQETIGAWAIPFIFERGNADYPADGQVHQAFGSWIAKRGN